MAYESFREWQTKSINQKQTTSALLLGLSGAALGFSVSLLEDVEKYIGFYQSSVFHLHVCLQIVSIGLGVLFSLNRVRDFDITSQIARQREKNPKYPGLSEMRSKSRNWGRTTKSLYKCQAISFGLAALAFIWFVSLRFGPVIYPGNSN